MTLRTALRTLGDPMANDEHVALLKKGVDAWNAWRDENPGVRPDLVRASLSHADLSRANFAGANLGGANLRKSLLGGANLRRSTR
jgi:uncharacterized protein YjbI with pentapeptide repeats